MDKSLSMVPSADPRDQITASLIAHLENLRDDGVTEI